MIITLKGADFSGSNIGNVNYDVLFSGIIELPTKESGLTAASKTFDCNINEGDVIVATLKYTKTGALSNNAAFSLRHPVPPTNPATLITSNYVAKTDSWTNATVISDGIQVTYTATQKMTQLDFALYLFQEDKSKMHFDNVTIIRKLK